MKTLILSLIITSLTYSCVSQKEVDQNPEPNNLESSDFDSISKLALEEEQDAAFDALNSIQIQALLLK